jgi:tetratricopeptide (TPR) repeat protein
VLAGRVAAVNSEHAMMIHVQNFITLDKLKNMSAVMAVRDYYRRGGFEREADIVDQAIPRLFPEIEENERAIRLSSSGAHQQAITLSKQILNSNPAFHMAYGSIGVYYVRDRQPDSALKYLAISDVMSPHNPIIHQHRAQAYLQKGEYDKARASLDEAYRLDSSDARIIGTYVQYGAITKDTAVADSWLARLKTIERVPAKEFYNTANACMRYNLDGTARDAFSEALRRGLDSTYIDSITARYPRFTPSP